MPKKLKTVEEWNEFRKPWEPDPGSGIACPKCGVEMHNSQPNVILTSNPPQKSVHCPKCNYATTVRA